MKGGPFNAPDHIRPKVADRACCVYDANGLAYITGHEPRGVVGLDHPDGVAFELRFDRGSNCKPITVLVDWGRYQRSPASLNPSLLQLNRIKLTLHPPEALRAAPACSPHQSPQRANAASAAAGSPLIRSTVCRDTPTALAISEVPEPVASMSRTLSSPSRS